MLEILFCGLRLYPEWGAWPALSAESLSGVAAVRKPKHDLDPSKPRFARWWPTTCSGSRLVSTLCESLGRLRHMLSDCGPKLTELGATCGRVWTMERVSSGTQSLKLGRTRPMGAQSLLGCQLRNSVLAILWCAAFDFVSGCRESPGLPGTTSLELLQHSGNFGVIPPLPLPTTTLRLNVEVPLPRATMMPTTMAAIVRRRRRRWALMQRR